MKQSLKFIILALCIVAIFVATMAFGVFAGFAVTVFAGAIMTVIEFSPSAQAEKAAPAPPYDDEREKRGAAKLLRAIQEADYGDDLPYHWQSEPPPPTLIEWGDKYRAWDQDRFKSFSPGIAPDTTLDALKPYSQTLPAGEARTPVQWYNPDAERPEVTTRVQKTPPDVDVTKHKPEL